MAAVADSALRRNVACPFCGLACDDLTIAVADGRVSVREAGCALSREGFERAPSDATPLVGGQAASLDEAVAAAAEILRRSRQPLFAGLATDVAGLRAVMQLAERTGGIVDHLGSDGLFRNLRVVQDSGWMTTTLSEVRNHMDLLLIVGPDPTPLFPRFFERCVAPRQTLFTDARQPPPVIRLGPPPEAGADVRAEEIPCALERLPEAVAALRCLIGDRPLQAANVAGLPAARLSALAERLKAAAYGVVAWMAGAFAFTGAELLTQALADLVRDVNQVTRCAALPLTGTDNVMGAHQVCTWQSGVPLRSSFAGGAPSHDPLLYGTARLLAEREVDALLWISSFRPLAPPAADLPTIVLAASPLRLERSPEVFIPVGTPGVDHAGEIFRTDGVVALPLTALRAGGRPSAADILNRIDRTLAAQGIRS
ncbi:MAG TPA: formylmethanofuran dehydrogenase subunit B [Candidatus Angelobacter sp.]|nr:formylmethanofuran dehydrogenase subunit B [Candidatus Angelobacter sp.]